MGHAEKEAWYATEHNVHWRRPRLITDFAVQLMPLSSHTPPSPFPPVGDHAVTSHSKAQEKKQSRFGRIRRQLWKFGMSLKRPDRLCT